MTTSHLIGHVRVLWRTERIIAELRLRRLLTSLGLQALAATIASCALLLFELAAYFALVRIWDAIWSAVALGFFNLVIAAAIVVWALLRPQSRELALAGEIHHQALAAFEAGLQNSEDHSHASLRAALENATPMLLPLIPLLIKWLRPQATEKAAKDPA
jgi:hypothetical protein